MTGTMVLIDAVGYVAMLLWGMHMVQSGVVRAYGSGLRQILGSALRNRFIAFLAGLGVTTVLQSSTATGLLTTSFMSSGMVELAPALAVMLGANVGTTLIVQALSFDVTWIASLLIVGGVISFKRGSRTRAKDLGRVAIGLGLMLHSLHFLVASLEPAETAPAVRNLLASLTGDPFLSVLLAALMTWFAHSSVAVVLLIMSLVQTQVLTPTAGLAFVLGANLGSAVNPVLEGDGVGNPANRRLPVGNLLNRIVGCALTIPFLESISRALAAVEPDPARQIADFHTCFNVVLAAIFLGPLGPFSRLLTAVLPDRTKTLDPAAPMYLDSAALETPSVALANAARETLRMADVLEAMIRGSLDAFIGDDRKLVGEVCRMDDVIDHLHDAIKLYLTKISPETLDEEGHRRFSEILAFAINLEHSGDIIDKNLMELAAKRIKNRLKFSEEGLEEIRAMLSRLLDNLHLALAVFMSGDVRSARKLIAEKEIFRDLERAAAENHFARLREGRLETVETSALHIDILRDVKRINSHIASAAYPILDQHGPSYSRERSAD